MGCEKKKLSMGGIENSNICRYFTYSGTLLTLVLYLLWYFSKLLVLKICSARYLLTSYRLSRLALAWLEADLAS